MQLDSTVIFENISTPESNSTSYTWNFGDGTTSTNKHAIHTFPKFDTSYLVCLNVSNHCGTYTWCDTIYIDSAHWNQLDKRVHINKNTKEETINIHLLNLEAMVYPNPTESNATFIYKSEEEHFEGKLVITDIGGRSIWESDLKQKSGNIKIPSQHWHDGLYFFHLQTSSGTKTGKFIVRH
jgi:PKD repeat protein